VEDVSVGVEAMVAMGLGVGQRPSLHTTLRVSLIIFAKQTKIVERTEPGIDAVVTGYYVVVIKMQIENEIMINLVVDTAD